MKTFETTIDDFSVKKLIESNKDKRIFIVVGPKNGFVAINKNNLTDFPLDESPKFRVADEDLSSFWGFEIISFSDSGMFLLDNNVDGMSTQFRFRTFLVCNQRELECEIDSIIIDFVRKEKHTFKLRTWY